MGKSLINISIAYRSTTNKSWYLQNCFIFSIILFIGNLLEKSDVHGKQCSHIHVHPVLAVIYIIN